MRDYDLGNGYRGSVMRRSRNPKFDPVVDWTVEGPGGRRIGSTDCGPTGDRAIAVAAMQDAINALESKIAREVSAQ